MYAIINVITVVMFGFARLLYGMRIEGEENIPRHGPFILGFDEIGHMATMMTTIFLARRILSGLIDQPVGFGDEFMWTQGWRRVYDRGGSTPIFPHGSGQGTHGLLRGLQALREGKIVMMNPSGDMSWDGRPVPPKKGVAWLALRSGAPIVLVMATKGAYEVRPKWMERPQLTGNFRLRVGKPLYLTDAPQTQVSDEMVAQANQKLRAEMDVLVYGPEPAVQ
jgi:1-acyl-sn-glycerol-3-phosphate acyltransferase